MLIVAFGAVLRSGKGAIVRCIPIARRSEIFWCDSGVFSSLTWSFVTDEATRRRVDPVLIPSSPGRPENASGRLRAARCWSRLRHGSEPSRRVDRDRSARILKPAKVSGREIVET
jgi:hypothetical protein